MSTLEERIATALSEDIASVEVAALIAEAEAAFAAAGKAVTVARERALDPLVIDPAARTELADAGFVVERLEAALPKLQARHRERVAREEATAWELEFAEVATRFNALADEWRETYPPMLAQLIEICTRAKALTSEIDRVNRTAPSGEQRRIPKMWTGGQLRLPHLFDGSEQVAWPPPVPSLAAQLALAMAASPHMFNPGPITGPPEWIAARNEERQKEGERMAAYYAAQEREREARNNREAAAAHEYEIAERNRRAGRT